MKTIKLRPFIIGFCLLLLGTLSVQAAPLRGIRVESSGDPIVVFLNGEPICSPSVSCFIANLSAGYYAVEVYDARYSGRQERGKRGELLYNQRVYYSGRDVKEISVGGVSNNRPSRPSRPSVSDREPTMSRNSFEEFYRALKAKSFDSDRFTLIRTALLTSRFTSEQCLRMTDLLRFDGDKVMIMKELYPRIVDKENFYMTVEPLKFQSEKDKIYEFVKNYHDEDN